jgi:tRNA (mo5U34)-methyltransferase
MCAMESSELARRVADIEWFHSIDLGGGLVTPGLTNTAKLLRRIVMPQDLTGQTVLDIGAWDGFYSFEAERRGARRVVAVDYHSWSDHPDSWGTKDGFELAREALGSAVEDVYADIMDFSPELFAGTFDVVLLLGVLYHLKDPMLALEKVASITGRHLIVETLIDLRYLRRPAAAFYPEAEHLNVSNWWGFNRTGVIGLLRAVGFDEVRVVWPGSRARRLGEWVYNVGNMVHSRFARSRNTLPLSYVPTGRLVIHAFKSNPT